MSYNDNQPSWCYHLEVCINALQQVDKSPRMFQKEVSDNNLYYLRIAKNELDYVLNDLKLF